MENGIVIMTGLDANSILNSAKLVLHKKKAVNYPVYLDYSNPGVSDAVVTILQSYIGYIKNKNYPEF